MVLTIKTNVFLDREDDSLPNQQKDLPLGHEENRLLDRGGDVFPDRRDGVLCDRDETNVLLDRDEDVFHDPSCISATGFKSIGPKGTLGSSSL